MNPWYPLDRRLGGPQSRSGRGGEEKNSQPSLKKELPTTETNTLAEVALVFVQLVRFGESNSTHKSAKQVQSVQYSTVQI
jgi:hypothetical protein